VPELRAVLSRRSLERRGYSEFYKSGTYRRLVSAFTGAKQAIEEIQTDQVQYANGLIQALSGYLKFQPGARLLDVGGSAGQVALEFQNFFGIDATVLDPAESGSRRREESRARGLYRFDRAMSSDEQFDLILLCRTIEHVQDLRGVLSRIRRLLAAGWLALLRHRGLYGSLPPDGTSGSGCEDRSLLLDDTGIRAWHLSPRRP